MDYAYHVFLSYRRANLWPRWVEKHFYPSFQHLLDDELGESARIFYDVRTIETGANWPLTLAKAHAESRVLVPLFSSQYFTSEWCVTELSLMQAREERCGFATPQNPNGLVVPARVHDGEHYPDSARDIESVDLSRFSNPLMSENSALAEALHEAMKRWIPDIVRAISYAPPVCDAAWHALAVDRFRAVNTQAPRTQLVPRLAAAS
jgi:hypothetical protein